MKTSTDIWGADPLAGNSGSPSGDTAAPRADPLGQAGRTPTGSMTNEAQADAGNVADRAKDALAGAKDKMGQMSDQATSQAHAGIDKTAQGLDSLASSLRDNSQSMDEGRIQNLASTAADKIQSGADMLHGQSADQLVQELESLVRRKPIESLLVAAGVGYVLSRAL